jgi:hypothetical protein
MHLHTFRGTIAAVAGLLLIPLVTVAPAAAGLLPVPCDPSGLIGDCEAPETSITAHPEASTTLTGASFTFTAPELDATLQCQLQGPSQAHDFLDCTGTAAGASSSDGTKIYADLIPGDYTFTVKAVDSVGNEDATPAVWAWTVVQSQDPGPDPDPNDTNAPNTTLTLEPKFWHLYPYASFEYTANEAVDHFVCELDSRPMTCPKGSFDLEPGQISQGMHTFSVAAVDTSGHIDATPDTVTFYRPWSVYSMNFSDGWTQGHGYGYFLNQYSKTTQRGATAIKGYREPVRLLALLVTKCDGCGVIDVFWKGEAIKRINLNASEESRRQLIIVKHFKVAEAGKLRIEVVSRNKPVFLEGWASLS